jgi:hypothetical protein
MTEPIDYMLTTVDNPFNPFTNYDDWFAWDFNAGYHTPGALAREVVTSDDLSELDQLIAINQAIDELVNENPTGVYKKVSRETVDA